MTCQSYAALFVTFVVLVLSGQSDRAFGAWVRLEAEGEPTVTRLFDVGSTEVGPSYAILAAGDTLTFILARDGALRIVTRPLAMVGEDIGTARFGMKLGSAKPRRLKRTSPMDSTVSLGLELSSLYAIGEENRLVVTNAVSGDVLHLWSRQKDGRPVLVRLLRHREAKANQSIRRRADQLDWNSRVVLTALGYDDNAYLAPAGENTAVGKTFANLEAAAGVKVKLAKRLSADLSYTFKGRFYDDDILNETRHYLALGQRWRSAPRGGWKVVVSEYMKWSDKTFFGRGADEEYETSDDTGSPLPLGDRFDHSETGAGLEVSRKLSETLRWSVMARTRDRNYTEDYVDVSDIYALDYAAHRMGSALDLKLRSPWRARIAWSRSWKKYEDKPARDAGGFVLETSFMELRYDGVDVRLKRRPNAGWTLDASWRRRDTDDQQAGYWDVSRTTAVVGSGWRWSGGHRIALSWRQVSYPYDNARLSYDQAEELRDKTITDWRLRGILSLGESSDLVLEFQDRDTDYNSPSFAYRRRLVSAGVEFRF